MKVEEILEKAVVAVFAARSDVIAAAIPVVRFRDRLTDRGITGHIMVRCEPAQRLADNYNYYFARLTVSADAPAENDPQAKKYDAAVDIVTDQMHQTFTAANLQTAVNAVQASSGITVNGLSQLDAADVADGSPIMLHAQNFQIALTYVKPT